MQIECDVCFNIFNTTTNKPFVCSPCGHTFDEKCAKILKNCATCRNEIKSIAPNWLVRNIFRFACF